MSQTTPRQITRTTAAGSQIESDQLVTEAPLEMRLGETPLAVLMRTPGDDDDLLLGFAITEGIVLNPAEVDEVVVVAGDPEQNRWEIVLADGVRIDPEQFRRNLYTSSSCGVCGKASIDALKVAAPEPPGGSGPGARCRACAAREDAGCPGDIRPHRRAARRRRLRCATANLLAVREDVGRHNAVDKVIGALASQRWPIGEVVLLVSGRVSFEIVQKAAVAGIPVVGGVSAASSLAAELAEELGLDRHRIPARRVVQRLRR